MSEIKVYSRFAQLKKDGTVFDSPVGHGLAWTVVRYNDHKDVVFAKDARIAELERALVAADRELRPLALEYIELMREDGRHRRADMLKKNELARYDALRAATLPAVKESER